MEMVNAIFFDSDLSQGFWDEALFIAYHILNKVSNKRSNTTPNEL